MHLVWVFVLSRVSCVCGPGWGKGVGISEREDQRLACAPPAFNVSTPNEQAAPREHPAPRTAGRRAAASSPALPPAHRSTCIIKYYILTYICRQKIESRSQNRHPLESAGPIRADM